MGLKCKFCDRFPLFGEKYALGQWRDERVDEMGESVIRIGGVEDISQHIA